MNAIKKITMNNLKRNPKKTIGTILGITLATMLICIVSLLTTSFYKIVLDTEINYFGYYHVMIGNLKEEELQTLKLNRQLKTVNPVYYVGKTISEEETTFQEQEILSMSKEVAQNLSCHISTGTYPKNEQEIIVSQYFAKQHHYHLGDIIKLDIEKSSDDIENHLETKQYKIVGITDNDVYFSKMITTNTTTYQYLNAYVALKNPFQYQKDIPLLLGLDNYQEAIIASITGNRAGTYPYYEINENLLKIEVFAFDETTTKMVIGFLSIALLIILTVSIFCIRNSFAIMVTERIKMYGMLVSVGATKKQMKKSIILEGLCLGMIGIPLGIFLGYIVTVFLVIVMNMILGNYFFPAVETMKVYATIFPFIVSFVLGFVTIYFSSISSIRKAERISPIQNIQNASNIKINPKKMKVPKWISKYFKTGGTIAYKNLKRNKRKYRATVIALTISIFCFVSIHFLVDEGFKEVKNKFLHYDYNILISNIEDFDNTMIERIKNIEGVKTTYLTYKSKYVTDDYTTSKGYLQVYDTSKVVKYSDSSIIIEPECDETKETYEEYIASCKGGYTKIRLVGLTDKDFKHYMKRLHLDNEKIKDAGILGDAYQYHDRLDDYKLKVRRKYHYKEDEILNGIYEGKELPIPLKAVGIQKQPSGLEYYGGGGYLVLNLKYYQDLGFTPDTLAIVTNNTGQVIKILKTLSDKFEIRNIDQEEQASRALYFALAVFLYTFIAIITTIGVTSVFNTITSNMRLRQSEFAILKSVGMTSKEFKRMIHLEIIFYSSKSFLYGTILGIIGSRVIYELLNMQEKTPYILPYRSILISMIFVFLFVFLVMHYSLSKIKKQNIIETIRNENV